MKKPVPRIVLTAAEFPDAEKLPVQHKGAKQRPVTELDDLAMDAPTQGLLLAAEDMRVLVGHVASLLENHYLAEVGVSAWLVHLYQVMDGICTSVRRGKLTAGCNLTIDDEAPADLENALSLGWCAAEQEWTDTPQSTLLAKLTDYWIDQVKDRGQSLLHLLTGQVDVVGACRSLTKLNEVRYPLPLTVE